MSIHNVLWSPRREQLDLETCKARLEEIGSRLKLGHLNEAEADAARLALLSQQSSPGRSFGQHLGTRHTLLVAAAAFLLVTGIGATAYVISPPEVAVTGDTNSLPGSDGELLAGLKNYAGSIATDGPASAAAASQPRHDVNSMIERLAARLQTTPDDVEGWQMLARSYFHTARYEQAATAFARAVELDPNSAELKRSYEEAKAKASASGSLATASSPRSAATTAAGQDGNAADVEKTPTSVAMPAPEHGAAIRAMVDRLADRLESSPQDADGWTSLMRSRVVLGEKEVAATAFRKALEIFKDDQAASGRITAAAIELGLKPE